MKIRFLLVILLVSLVIRPCFAAEESTDDLPLNKLVAGTPRTVSITIPKTARAMDGGSILNHIRLSNGRLFTLSLDFPLDLATDKVTHEDIHFTIFISDDWKSRETLAHGGAAEKRLIELLDVLIETTVNSHEKKNATSLVRFLKDRKQGFPMGRKWWDFTPWSLK